MSETIGDEVSLRGRPLLDLVRHGQSLWLAYLRRGLVAGGELSRLTRLGVSGIRFDVDAFADAAAGPEYAEPLAALRRESDSGARMFEQLVLEDVSNAAGSLAKIHRLGTSGQGWVAIDVPPHREGSADEAVAWVADLEQAAGVANVIARVPATAEGLQLARNLVAAGYPVYVGPVFGLAQLQAVLDAYRRGIELCIAAGKDVSRVRAVAAFDLVRLDVVVDEVLRDRASDAEVDRDLTQALMGRAAIATAKLAWSMAQEASGGPQWSELERQGAHPLWLAWEGTHTMNPSRRDVEYVEELIGQRTLSVMSRTTLNAFADHGTARSTLDRQIGEAGAILDDLARVGIDMEQVAADLLRAGAAYRTDRYTSLLRQLAEGDEAPAQVDLLPGDLATELAAAGAELERLDVARRLWERDPTLWAGGDTDPASIRDRLGWLGLPEAMREEALPLLSHAASRPASGGSAVLLGMGGSSLGAEACRVACAARNFFVLDTTVPRGVAAIAARVKSDTCWFLVASKSGTTVETLALADYFREYAAPKEGAVEPRFVAITDPGTPLHERARGAEYERVWLTPPDVGGRFSVLSPFGLLPMALMGMDVSAVLDAACRMSALAAPEIQLAANEPLQLGCLLAAAHTAGRDKLTLLPSTRLSGFADWVEQLVAESLGKCGKGLVPVSQEPLGTADAYGEDRLFVSLRFVDDDEPADQVAVLEELAERGHPVLRIVLAAPEALGAEFVRWQIAVAVAGALIGVNPFDEPDVRGAKIATQRLLDALDTETDVEPRPVAEGKQLLAFADPDSDPELASAVAGPDVMHWLRAHLLRASPGDYLAIQAFLAPDMTAWHALQGLRALIRDRLQVATTVGWGPRYLHSTGQLHKGGPDSGLFLQLTGDTPSDLAIPGRSYSFGTLARAQAVGDFQALVSLRRRVLRVHLRGESEAGLAALVDALQQALGAT